MKPHFNLKPKLTAVPARIKRLLCRKRFWLTVCGLTILWLLPSVVIRLWARPYLLSGDSDRQFTYGIVFGAGILPDKQPTPYLQARLDEAATLYHEGRIKKVLVSGDNGTRRYDEPTTMSKYLQTKGVAKSDITLDYAGFSTYDTCYRARAIFGVSNDVLLISHAYHLPRAVQTCRALGVFAYGQATAGQRVGRDYSINYLVRETLSINKALFQELIHAKPTALGNPEPITNHK